MDYRDIQNLRAFFLGIKDAGFKKIPSFATVDGQRTPIDKERCLQLLRELPQFQGDQFKDENAILEYLRNPNNRRFLSGQFKEGRVELTEALEEKPVAVEAVSEQPGGGQEAPAEPGLPAQVTGGEQAGTMLGGVPSLNTQPIIHHVPRINRPVKPPEVKTYPKPPVIETGLDYEGKPLKIPEGIKSAGETLGSNAGIGIKKGLTGVGRGLGSMLGDLAGRIGRPAFRIGMAGIDSITRPNFGLKAGSFGGKGAGRFAFLFLGAFFLAALGIALFGGLSGSASTTGGNVGIGTTGSTGNIGIGRTAPVGPIIGSDFATIMRGHGRNTDILGDEESFVSIVKNNDTRYRLNNKEDYLRQIYRVSVNKNLNPLAILVLWGTEQGFNITNTEFSCPVRVRSSFGEQLQCATNTINNWMNYFDRNKNPQGTITLPSTLGNICTFDDPFLFAMEKYGPVCTAYDSNDFFLSNFVKFYKELAGVTITR